MARGKAHSAETKAAVMAALLSGQSADAVAARYTLPVATVKRWKLDLKAKADQLVEPQKKAEVGDLLFDYLRETLTTLAVQVRQFRDPDWLRKQPASEAAVLHGVLTDKAIRLLAALESPDEG